MAPQPSPAPLVLVLALIAAVVVVVGSFGPWIKLGLVYLGPLAHDGDDGIITLIAGIAASVLLLPAGIAVLPSWHRVALAGIVLAGIALVLAALTGITDWDGLGNGEARAGWGLIAVTAGGVVGAGSVGIHLLGRFMAFARRKPPNEG